VWGPFLRFIRVSGASRVAGPCALWGFARVSGHVEILVSGHIMPGRWPGASRWADVGGPGRRTAIGHDGGRARVGLRQFALTARRRPQQYLDEQSYAIQ
jgi:hypothetical protein